MYSSFSRGTVPLFNISGNPDLKPEESKTYELAVGHKGDNYRLDLVYHYSKLDNLISSYTASGAFPVFNVSYRNIDKAVISGTELTLTMTPAKGLTVKGSIESLDNEDEATGERLTNGAKINAKLHVAYGRNAMSYFLNVKTLRDYYGTAENSPPPPNTVYVNTNYTVADVKVSYAYDEGVEFFAGIDNIENKELPYNMQMFGTQNDPGERYYYIGSTIKF